MGEEVKEDRGGREWKRPAEGWVKINCDGAFKIKQGSVTENEVGIGVVIRNKNREMVAGITKKVLIGSSIEAEAVALREGVWLAAERKMDRIMLETDSEILYKEITGRRKIGCWKIKSYIEDILKKKDSFIQFECSKINRLANKAAN